jgi:UDP-N-acetylmuramate--alanine ligase
VLATLDLLGFARTAAAAAIKAYSGVRRRFDIIDKVGNITVVDDYGHHPTEIAATLATARGLGFEQIHMVFQPHRYTRTKALFDDFARAFSKATTLTIMAIYSAGEQPIDGITSESLQSAIKIQTPKVEVCCIDDQDEIIAHLKAIPGAQNTLIITQGAGSVTNLAPAIAAAL